MLIETVGPGERVRVYRGGAARGPARRRPAGAPVRYRGSGVAVSQAVSRPPARPRPITPVTTVLLALVAAGITVWLGLIAQFGAAATDGGAAVPEQLGVVRVHSGESLTQLAARVAPEAPATLVAARIRELNALDTTGLSAGQTLIAPIG